MVGKVRLGEWEIKGDYKKWRMDGWVDGWSRIEGEKTEEEEDRGKRGR